MVVDDDLVLLELFTAALPSEKWVVASFSSSTEAGHSLAKRPFSALLTDALPGYQKLIVEFRKRNPSSPIVVLTGALNSEAEERAHHDGADLVLFKPIGITILKENLHQLIAAAAQRSTVAQILDPDISEVIQLEEQLLQAWIRADIKVLDKLLGEEYVFAAGTPEAQSKQQRLDAVASGHLRYSNVECQQREAKRYGDICVVSSTLAVNGVRYEKDISGMYSSVRIYQLNNGRWKAVAGQLIQRNRRAA